jgi:hypothetical protein
LHPTEPAVEISAEQFAEIVDSTPPHDESIEIVGNEVKSYTDICEQCCRYFEFL